MMIARFGILVFAFALFKGCESKVVVVPVPKDNKPIPADGVIYALPNTVVRVQLKIDKTSRTATRFSPFAQIFAPGEEVVCGDESCTKEKKITYSVQQASTFATYGEPDPDSVFLVKFVGKGAIDQTMSMTWNETGLLSEASSSVTNRTGDVVLSVLKLAAGLGTRAALGASEVKMAPDIPQCEDEAPADKWILTKLANAGGPSSRLRANYCAIDLEQRKKYPEKEDNELPGSIHHEKAGNVLKAATDAYVDNVAPLIASRLNILNGTSKALDGGSLLSHIEAEIKQQLTILYLGSKETLTWDGALDVRTLQTSDPIPILRLDSENGVCTDVGEIPNDVKPFPHRFNVLSGDKCGMSAPIYLTLSYFPAPENQLYTRITDISDGERSFRYRLPAQVKAAMCDKVQGNQCVHIDDKDNIYGSGQFFVAQLGRIISLPANRHSKSLSYDLAFIEATGGLKTFKLGTTGALDAGTIDALAAVGSTIIDARNKSADDLNRLTKQDQLLKLQDDICTIQKKYGLPCTVQPH